MKTLSLLLCLGLALVVGGRASAQTNTADIATNAPFDAAASPAPVVTNAAPAPDPNALPSTPPPAMQPPSPSGPVQMPPALAPQGQAQPPDIMDIRPPFFFIHSWGEWLWIALAVLVAVAILVLVWVWLRDRPARRAKNAYDLTLEKLEKARALMNEAHPEPYAVAVSEAIRTYLGLRFQSPSTRRTTDEFLRQMEQDPGTPLAEHRDLLRGFLQSCDLVKFARYQPTSDELEQVQQRAFSFVTATKPDPAAAHRNGHTP